MKKLEEDVEAGVEALIASWSTDKTPNLEKDLYRWHAVDSTVLYYNIYSFQFMYIYIYK
jgi:hypothetical protein